MKWREISVGGEVYHGVYTHWGRGVVRRVCGVNMMEAMFERGRRRVEVEFEGVEGVVRLEAAALRKTPNRRKIREMVAMYRKRGLDAVDGGHVLLLPESASYDRTEV